jgi:hypothetical protein
MLLCMNLAAGISLIIVELGAWRAYRERNRRLRRLERAHVRMDHGGSLHPCCCGYALLAADMALMCGGRLHSCDRCQPVAEAIR